MRIMVRKIIRSPFAVLEREARVVYNRIVRELKKREKIILDFEEVEIVTSEFLEGTIERLYLNYKPLVLSRRLKVENMDEYDMELLKKIVDNVKRIRRNR